MEPTVPDCEILGFSSRPKAKLVACGTQALIEHSPELPALAKWRSGAQDIQELPLLASSTYMETVPMAGKLWQPSHEQPQSPIWKGEKQVLTLCEL